MKLVLVFVLAAGCGFRPAIDADGGAGHGSDANLEAMPGAEPMPNGAPCFAPDKSGLVLCLELDDPGLTQARDGSPARHDATAMNVNVATRDVPASSQAAQILSTSVIQTGMSADFDVQTFTLMMWVHRENTPGVNGRYGLIHAIGQYYLAIDDQDRVLCVVQSNTGPYYVNTGPTVAMNEWDLVACTYDQAQLCNWTFANGSTSGNSSCMDLASKTLSTGIAPGISVGAIAVAMTGYTSHLAGKLDAVRIYNKALDQQHLCMAAGLSGC